MKRLFGLIGFTFLFVLSAVFYSDFNEIIFAIIGSLGLNILTTRSQINILIKKLQQADISVMKSSPPIHHAVS